MTPGAALALLTIPYVFTQDGLLTTGDFIARAKERGHELSPDLLQDLHNLGLLKPFYRVSDFPVSGRQLDVEVRDGPNARGWTFQAGADGRLRDSEEEGYSSAWPYSRQPDEHDRRWWNGFVYSHWQLVYVGHALSEYRSVKSGLPRTWGYQRRARERKLVRVLSALSTRYLPGILGRISIPMGTDEEGLRQYRATSEVRHLLEVADFDMTALESGADNLLAQAHREPLGGWLPLTRYASYSGWSKLRGQPLDAMWRRVAAEVLLRAHEDLAAEGVLDPLPDLTGSSWWTSQHDRLTPRHVDAPTLERALAELGLSPHPKVILLVEGETELYHVPRLLAEFGLTQPQDVRVQRTKGSKINAHLIARYGVTPRVGRKLDNGWLLDASLTALLIAMDPENDFATQADRDDVRRKLQDAIREEVEYQDARISQEELDHLVHVQVWGDDKYELANFTDDELVPAVTALALKQHNPLVSSPTWEQDLRSQLMTARVAHDDIKVPLGRMRVKEDKVGLAQFLWPVLLSKCDAEYANDNIQTPILELVLEVRRLVHRLTGVFALNG
ncbi:hypothetical protein [Saccharothrix luteola]|uniref:hypothetical protein n=1 Tax=Saccharothrix luteola TaxID=2893018 RepID=UPI001E53DC40|nr:hypothetical protein [Saccharothrix luteola]MCC8245068.1 hypothetical protein [Saccharothrix luteola]